MLATSSAAPVGGRGSLLRSIKDGVQLKSVPKVLPTGKDILKEH